MTANLPTPHHTTAPLPGGVPAGWTVAYGTDGTPLGYAPAPPPQIIMQMPEQTGLSREMRELIVVVTLILAVVVVCTAAVCAVVVIAGGTLIGIVGTVGAHLPFIGVTLVGVILAAGWAAQRVRATVKTRDGDHGG